MPSRYRSTCWRWISLTTSGTRSAARVTHSWPGCSSAWSGSPRSSASSFPAPRETEHVGYPAVTLRSAARPVWRLSVAAAALAALAGCGLLSSPAAPVPPGAGESPGPAPATGSPASPSPAGPSCPATPAKFTCAVWENAHAHTHIYMASTSKLAMAVALLMQNQAGVIHLSAGDMSVMQDMLHVSSDTAADTLWFKFGASFYTSYFPRIGLANARYVSAPGITDRKSVV